MINDEEIILLCFYYGNLKKCRSLKRTNDAALSFAVNSFAINSFAFYDEFDLDTIEIPKSTYDHYGTKMANYQGFPLIVGDFYNVKLEMLVNVENRFEWIEGPEYPYGEG